MSTRKKTAPVPLKKVASKVVKAETLPQFVGAPADLAVPSPEKGGPPSLPPAFVENMIKPGEVRNPVGAPKGKRLSTRIMELLNERSVTPGGSGTRLDDAAEAFVRQLELGSLPHFKEILDRTEGKVTQTVDLEVSVKQYIDTPTEGPDAP
jgi:hypothetical protein